MRTLNFLPFLCLLACSSSSNGDTKSASTSAGAGGNATAGARASANTGSGGSRSVTKSNADAGVEDSGNQSSSVQGGAGGHAGGTGGKGGQARGAGSGGAGSGGRAHAGAVAVPDDADAGAAPLLGMGSCCSTHTSPGCSNADLQVCVCEKRPSCCTDAWTAECADIVMQKWCEVGVRECVCGSGDKQWMQADCCDKQWSDTCDSVAEHKCGATHGCF